MKKTIVLVVLLGLTTLASATYETFDTDPVLASSQTDGAWYTDRYAPAGFTSEYFDGDDRLKISISGSDAQGEVYERDNFYDTQGRKYTTDLTGSVQSFSIDLYVDSDWDTESRYTGIWATGYDSTSTVSAYSMIQYINDDSTTAGFYTYDYINGAWDLFYAVSDFGEWYTLTIELTVGVGMEYFINGVSIGTFADTDTVSLGNAILNTGNYGEDYDVYYDNFVAVPEPVTLALMGLGGLLLGRRKK